jgi:hypothetical protein
MNNQNNEKYKKFSIPGVSVGSFKKEFERKASLTDASSSAAANANISNSSTKRGIDTKRDLNDNNNKVPQDDKVIKSNSNDRPNSNASSTSKISCSDELNQSDSKNSVHSFSLEEARRSMENSIALLQRAKNESRSKDVDNLCAKTESFTLQQKSDSGSSNGSGNDRERKLQAAREIIGNAIPPSRLIGIRKPPMMYGLNGRSVSGGVIQTPITPTPFKTSSSRVVPESAKGKPLASELLLLFALPLPTLSHPLFDLASSKRISCREKKLKHPTKIQSRVRWHKKLVETAFLTNVSAYSC